MLKDEWKSGPNIYKVHQTKGQHDRHFAKMATIIPPIPSHILCNVTLLVLPSRAAYFLSPRIRVDPVICFATRMWLNWHCTSSSKGLATSAFTLATWVHHVKTSRLNTPWGLKTIWRESQGDSQHQPSDKRVRSSWTI